MLLGALKVLQENRENLKGAVRFVFQTGEEICRGAKIAIEEGALNGVDSVFGLHIGSIAGTEIPAGTLVVTPGCCMAAIRTKPIATKPRNSAIVAIVIKRPLYVVENCE